MIQTLIEQLVELLGVVFQGTGRLFNVNFRNSDEHDLTGQFLPETELLSKREKGFNLTGKRQLSVRLSYQNALITGSTGVGKSTVILIPSILTMDSSFVINDPSGELHLKTSGFLSRRGYEVKILNYAKPEISVGFNVLARANSKADISKVANTLVRASLKGGKDNPFWNIQACSILVLLISMTKKMRPEHQHLANVRRLLQVMSGDPKKIDRLVVQYGDEALMDSYLSFVAMAPKHFHKYLRNGVGGTQYL